MLNQHTMEKLQALRLVGMAEAFRAQAEQPDMTQLSFEERFALPSTEARCRSLALAPRGLDRALVRSLAQTSAWVGQHQNVFLIGPTGIGKSF